MRRKKNPTAENLSIQELFLILNQERKDIIYNLARKTIWSCAEKSPGTFDSRKKKGSCEKLLARTVLCQKTCPGAGTFTAQKTGGKNCICWTLSASTK